MVPATTPTVERSGELPPLVATMVLDGPITAVGGLRQLIPSTHVTVTPFVVELQLPLVEASRWQRRSKGGASERSTQAGRNALVSRLVRACPRWRCRGEIPVVALHELFGWRGDMMTGRPDSINSEVADPARRYDYWLGGKDNFRADRDSGDVIANARRDDD